MFGICFPKHRSEADQARFWEAIAEIQKLGYNSFPRTKCGGYIIETVDKMMFTDGEYKAPTLSKVIEFVYGDLYDTTKEKGMIRNEARETGRTEKSTALIERMHGEGVIAEYNAGDYKGYDWKNGRGEGTYRGRTDSKSGSRGVRYGGENGLYDRHEIKKKFPVGEDTSLRALLANAFEELAKTDAENESIRKYQERVAQFQELETKLKDLRAQIRELYTADGKLDTKKIRELQFEANATANRIETLDRMPLRTESTQQFQNVLKREQDQARAREIKKAKDAVIAFRHDASAEIRETNPAAGKNDSETSNGIFFNTNDHDIGLGGGIQMEVYVLIGLTQQYDKLVFVGLFWERCKKHCRGGIHASRR